MNIGHILFAGALGFLAGFVLAVLISINATNQTADKVCRDAGYVSGEYFPKKGFECVVTPVVKKVLP